jgi:hypothetical protein
MNWREQRVVENESRFRLVNERLRDHVAGDGHDGAQADALTVLCECADIDCTQRIELPLSTYEWIRSESTRFVVVPGHDLPSYERVIRDDTSYMVVEKFEVVQAEASVLDPRTG